MNVEAIEAALLKTNSGPFLGAPPRTVVLHRFEHDPATDVVSIGLTFKLGGWGEAIEEADFDALFHVDLAESEIDAEPVH